ncbi:MAG: hypothetical protein JKX76_01960 [Colwellia sp.]|nr:hypothetical protein [Colwellia sp.]
MITTTKILLLGPGGGGKTTLVHRLMGNDFVPKYSPTNFAIQHSFLVGEVQLIIRDTAGQRLDENVNTMEDGSLPDIVLYIYQDKLGLRRLKEYIYPVPVVLFYNKINSKSIRHDLQVGLKKVSAFELLSAILSV